MRKLKRKPVLTREACVVTLLEAETAAVTEQRPATSVRYAKAKWWSG